MHGYLWGYGYSANLSYILFVLPALILSLFAQWKVKRAYSKMSRMSSSRGYSGLTAANRVLQYYGVTGVGFAQIKGELTDNFDPRTNLINLSDGVYGSSSLAAIGIACHEAGHAAQHAEGYMPIKIRNMLLPVCRIGSVAGVPLAVIGYFVGFEPLVLVGLVLYSAIMLFQLATLPVELNASRRALKCIEETGVVSSEEELKAVKSVLTAAALTYVASLAVSFGNLLRLIIMFTGNRRKR